MFLSMRKIADKFIEFLEEAAEEEKMLEMRNTVARYTVNVISDVAFGIQVNSLKDDTEFMHMGQRFFEPTKLERIYQIVANTQPWIYKLLKISLVSKEVTDFFTEVVNNAIDFRRKNKIERNDFLSFLMKIKETKGINLTDLEEMKGVNNFNAAIDENSIGKRYAHYDFCTDTLLSFGI